MIFIDSTQSRYSFKIFPFRQFCRAVVPKWPSGPQTGTRPWTIVITGYFCSNYLYLAWSVCAASFLMTPCHADDRIVILN